MSFADVFDASVSRRCYKSEMSYEQAFDIIRSSPGTHFDAELGKYFFGVQGRFYELLHTSKCGSGGRKGRRVGHCFRSGVNA